jgi:hypothetical protein
VNFEWSCPESNFAEIRVARRTDPPPNSFAEVTCETVPEREASCYDGEDDDEDCLVDLDDPDCF